VARLIYTERALADLERLIDFLAASDPETALPTVELIAGAVNVLADHPLIGRPVERSGLRELVVSRGRTGYVALYSFELPTETVLVLGIRHQREAGFDDDLDL
jgi:plasmid stabilization system protein ParE